jgi:hypothetical protein
MNAHTQQNYYLKIHFILLNRPRTRIVRTNEEAISTFPDFLFQLASVLIVIPDIDRLSIIRMHQ